jgi:hypothetical protein
MALTRRLLYANRYSKKSPTIRCGFPAPRFTIRHINTELSVSHRTFIAPFLLGSVLRIFIQPCDLPGFFCATICNR